MMKQVAHPKVVILGAGSFYFGCKGIWQMVHSRYLNGGTLALVDTDPERLKKMQALARMVVDHHGVDLTIEASTDRTDVLDQADFVVLSFACRNAHFRGIDCQISAKYGIRMCSGDTIGPGGVLRTAREFPQIIRACQDVQRLCPDAWVINYINPTAVHGIGLRRYFPGLKSFALCDAQWHLRRRYADLAGVSDDEKLIMRPTGPNHFTWLSEATYDGRDMMPTIVDRLRDRADEDANRQVEGDRNSSKGYQNNAIAVELYHMLGALPTVIGHSKEYVPYYQGLSTFGRDRHDPLKIFDAHQRMVRTEQAWQRIDLYLEGRAPIDEFDEEFDTDPAMDVIEAMWGGLERRFFINTMNCGAVPNMDEDAFLELYCDLSMDGPSPVAHPPLPRGIRGLCEQVLDTHELTAQAVYEQRRDLLRRALLVDPLTRSIGDTEALLDELLDAESDALPAALVEGAY